MPFPPRYGDQLIIDSDPVQLELFHDALEKEVKELFLSAKIFPDITAPHVFPWYRNLVASRKDGAQSCLAFNKNIIRDSTPTSWRLPFFLRYQGDLIGSQEIRGHISDTGLIMSSGSWLDLKFHGQGLGSAARRVALTYAFTYLNVTEAYSFCTTSNHASARVSLACGYEEMSSDDVPQPLRNEYQPGMRAFRLHHQSFNSTATAITVSHKSRS